MLCAEEVMSESLNDWASRDTRIARLRQETCSGDLGDDRDATLDLTDASDATSQSKDPALGTCIGPYQLVRKLGHGGFGIVYLAEQRAPLQRTVALKVIKPGMDSHEVIARFEAERQALAMMDHPHIARVLDAGTTGEGRPYFVMELVQGVPIHRYCDERHLTVRQRLQLFVKVCLAVQHAHQKGIIHRDLKPSNILVRERDGVPEARIIDFGIAKALTYGPAHGDGITIATQMLGTPAYMSPEQFGNVDLDVDTRSDVYSLGVMLYQLLSGSLPFDSKRLRNFDPWELQRIICEEQPVRPSKSLSTVTGSVSTVAAHRETTPRELFRHLCGDLDWIVLKALEKNREDRYESASALAADVERYLNHEIVLACPPSKWAQLRKFVRRNLMLLSAVTVVIGALVVGTALATWQAIRADAERERADRKMALSVKERIRAERAEQGLKRQASIAQDLLYGTQIQLSAQQHLLGDDEQAQILLDRWIPQPGATDRRGIEWRLLKQMLYRPGEELLRLPGDVSSVRIAPNGRYLVTATDGGTIRRYDLTARRELPAWETHLTDVRRLNFSADGALLAAISYEAEVVVVSTTDGSVQTKMLESTSPSGNSDVQFAHRNNLLFATGEGRVVRIWHADDPDTTDTWELPCEKILDCAISPGLPGVAFLTRAAKRNDAITFYEDLKGNELGFFLVDIDSASLALSHNGKYAAVGGNAGEVEVWDWPRRNKLARLQVSEKAAELNFSVDDRLLSIADRSGVVHIWHWQEAATQPPRDRGAPAHVHWQAHARPARSVVFAPDDRQVISAGFDGRIIRWTWEASESLRLSRVSRPDDLAWCDANQTIAISNDSGLRWYDSHNGAIMREAAVPQGARGWSIASSPNQRWLAWTTFSGPILLCDMNSHTPPVALPQSRSTNDEVDILQFFLESNELIAIDMEPTLRVRSWEIQVGELPRLSSDRSFPQIKARKLALSGSQKTLHVMTGDALIQLAIDSGNELQRWSFEGDDVSRIALSSAGDALAVGRKDRQIDIIDAETGNVRKQIFGHLGAINGLRFSPDGKTLLALDERGNLIFWLIDQGTDYGTEMLTWPSREPIRAFQLSPDGNWLALLHEHDTEIIEIAPADEFR